MKLPVLTFFLTFTFTVYGQRITIVRIADQLSKEPLAQASAHRVGDTASALTNSSGYLQIQAAPGDSLVIRAAGYQTGAIVVPEVSRFQACLSPVDSMLAFNGGMQSFYRQVGDAFRYPHSARKRGLQGTTYTSFVVGEAGEVTNIRPLTSRVSLLHKEVVRVLENLEGRWDASYAGQTITLPVVFRVDDGGKDLKIEPQPIPGRLLEVVVVVGYSSTTVRQF